MELERSVSATKAREIIEEKLGIKLSQSKMTRLMQSGKIPSHESALDARKRMIYLSDLEKWMEQAKQELGAEKERPAA